MGGSIPEYQRNVRLSELARNNITEQIKEIHELLVKKFVFFLSWELFLFSAVCFGALVPNEINVSELKSANMCTVVFSSERNVCILP